MSWLEPSKGCLLRPPHCREKQSKHREQNTGFCRFVILLFFPTWWHSSTSDFLCFLFKLQLLRFAALRGVPELPRQCRAQLLLAPRLAHLEFRFPPISSGFHRRSLWRSLVADPSFLGSALYLSGSVLFAAMPYWSAASPATMTKMGQAHTFSCFSFMILPCGIMWVVILV